MLQVSLGEAKSIVHRSHAWADAREAFEGLQEDALAAAEELAR